MEIAEILGYDTANFKVMRPEETIDLYIAEEYENANEEDFRKAFWNCLNMLTIPLNVAIKSGAQLF
jgi:nuclear pore complex protein Nup133